jgi:hypothetical protein
MIVLAVSFIGSRSRQLLSEKCLKDVLETRSLKVLLETQKPPIGWLKVSVQNFLDFWSAGALACEY